MKKEFFFNPKGFECTKCGECCRHFRKDNAVFLFPSDVRKICNFLTISENEFTKKHTYSSILHTAIGAIKILFIQSIDGVCHFLDNEGFCKVNEVKPAQCDRGPFGFFWDGTLIYDCMKDINVPKDWDTSENDKILMNEYIKPLDS